MEHVCDNDLVFRLTTTPVDSVWSDMMIFENGTMVHIRHTNENKEEHWYTLNSVTIRELHRIIRKFCCENDSFPGEAVFFEGTAFSKVEISGGACTVTATNDISKVNCKDVFHFVMAVFGILEKYEWIAFARILYVLDKDADISEQIQTIAKLLQTGPSEYNQCVYGVFIKFLVQHNEQVCFLSPFKKDASLVYRFLLKNDMEADKVDNAVLVGFKDFIEVILNRNSEAKIWYFSPEFCVSSDHIKIFMDPFSPDGWMDE